MRQSYVICVDFIQLFCFKKCHYIFNFSLFLVQVVTEEEQFRAESRKLAALLADPEVEV